MKKSLTRLLQALGFRIDKSDNFAYTCHVKFSNLPKDNRLSEIERLAKHGLEQSAELYLETAVSRGAFRMDEVDKVKNYLSGSLGRLVLKNSNNDSFYGSYTRDVKKASNSTMHLYVPDFEIFRQELSDITNDDTCELQRLVTHEIAHIPQKLRYGSVLLSKKEKKVHVLYGNTMHEFCAAMMSIFTSFDNFKKQDAKNPKLFLFSQPSDMLQKNCLELSPVHDGITQTSSATSSCSGAVLLMLQFMSTVGMSAGEFYRATTHFGDDEFSHLEHECKSRLGIDLKTFFSSLDWSLNKDLPLEALSAEERNNEINRISEFVPENLSISNLLGIDKSQIMLDESLEELISS